MSSADKPKKSQPATPPSSQPVPQRTPKSKTSKVSESADVTDAKLKPVKVKLEKVTGKSRPAAEEPPFAPSKPSKVETKASTKRKPTAEDPKAKKQSKAAGQRKDSLQMELRPVPGFKPGLETPLFGSAKKKRAPRVPKKSTVGDVNETDAPTVGNQKIRTVLQWDAKESVAIPSELSVTPLVEPEVAGVAEVERKVRGAIEKVAVIPTPVAETVVTPIPKVQPASSIPSVPEIPYQIPWVPDSPVNVVEDVPPPTGPFDLYVPPILLTGDQPEKTPMEGSTATFEQVGVPGLELTISALSDASLLDKSAGALPSTPGRVFEAKSTNVPSRPPAEIRPEFPQSGASNLGHSFVEAPAPRIYCPVAPTGEVWLHARDPYCLYCCWSYRAEELAGYAAAVGGDWQLKIYSIDDFLQPRRVVRFPLGADHAFTEVDMPGMVYVAEIGLARGDGRWETHARSNRAATPAVAKPPVEVSEPRPSPVFTPWLPPAQSRTVELAHVSDGPAVTPVVPTGKVTSFGAEIPTSRFGTPPRRAETLGIFRVEVPDPESAVKAWQVAGFETRGGPFSADIITPVWTETTGFPAASKAVSCARPGEATSEQLAVLPPSGDTVPGSMPPTTPGTPREFWMRVNAELVIYGSTDPAAAVRIADQAVRLRPDGSFSFRFALPDGDYPLNVVARSGDGVETRSAALEFSRTTTYSGCVGIHPPEVVRQPPTALAIAAGLQ